MIPGSGRSAGEGIGYPPQYSWPSLVAQLVKNPPAMWETWIRSLGWKDPLGKGKKGYPLQYSSLDNSMDCIFHGVTKNQTRLSDLKKKNCMRQFLIMSSYLSIHPSICLISSLPFFAGELRLIHWILLSF